MRRPKPYRRTQNDTYYVQLDGKQINLGKDKEAAWDKYHKIMARRGEGVREGDYTVRQVIDFYWNWLVKNRAESTCDRRKPIFKSFGESVPANLKARELRAFHVDKWISDNARIKSSTTANTRITLIKGMMNWAESMNYIDKNPIEKMPKPPVRVPEEFVPGELWPKVLELATDEAFRDLLIVFLSSGCRPQEIKIVEARHLDLAGKRFILPLNKSKGQRRQRVIYLPDEALAIVQRWIKEYPEGPLFRNSKGKPWGRNAIRCRMRRFKRKLKMPWLTATKLRHSFAHYRLSNGQDPLVVSKLMGHVDTRMLATRYGHIDANMGFMVDAANQIGFPGLPGIAPSPPAVT